MIEEDLAKLNTMNINELKKLFLRYFNAHPTLKTKEAYTYNPIIFFHILIIFIKFFECSFWIKKNLPSLNINMIFFE